jgi:methyl-accepting chemotaxis protein
MVFIQLPDIKVKDEEYADAANELSELGEEFAAALQQYSEILEYIAENALSSVEMSRELRSNSQRALSARSAVKDVNEKLVRECREYVSKIDQADQYLYN